MLAQDEFVDSLFKDEDFPPLINEISNKADEEDTQPWCEKDDLLRYDGEEEVPPLSQSFHHSPQPSTRSTPSAPYSDPVSPCGMSMGERSVLEDIITIERSIDMRSMMYNPTFLDHITVTEHANEYKVEPLTNSMWVGNQIFFMMSKIRDYSRELSHQANSKEWCETCEKMIHGLPLYERHYNFLKNRLRMSIVTFQQAIEHERMKIFFTPGAAMNQWRLCVMKEMEAYAKAIMADENVPNSVKRIHINLINTISNSFMRLQTLAQFKIEVHTSWRNSMDELNRLLNPDIEFQTTVHIITSISRARDEERSTLLHAFEKHLQSEIIRLRRLREDYAFEKQ